MEKRAPALSGANQGLGMDTIPTLITATIVDLTKQWLNEGIVSTVRQIGNGLCEEFAQQVLDRLHVERPNTLNIVTAAFTDDWWLRESPDAAICFEADIPRLRAEGAPLPDDMSDKELSQLIGCATHMWIVHDGMHYDATAPEGRSHFLLMPFFADQIAGHRAKREENAA